MVRLDEGFQCEAVNVPDPYFLSYFLCPLFRSCPLFLLFVMSPHPKDFDGVFGGINLIDETVLDVDAARISARQVSHQFFIGRWILRWISGEEVEQTLGVGFEIRGRDLPGVLLGLPRINDRPTHQPGLVEVLPSGSAMPLRIDSRIPGIERR